MSLFCLVHGAYHGAWCWNLLIPHLESRGHKTVTMDLPIEDPSVSLSQYAELVIRSLPEIDDDIVLVGHSMAGTIIPLVAEAVKVRRLVFLAALIPHPGISTLDQLYHHLNSDTLNSLNYQPKDAINLEQFRDEPEMFNPACEGKNFANEAVAREFFYHDCPPDVARWAISKLRNHPYMSYIFDVNPLQVFPDVECTYIVCKDDRILSPTWSRYAARKRLGIDAIELSGGHCPYLSHPAHLASVLHGELVRENPAL